VVGLGFAAAGVVGLGFAAAGVVGLGFAAARAVLVALARAAELRRVDVDAAGLGFAAAEAVLVDERGARGAPALGAPTERGEPDVPRRVPVPVRGRARVAAAARPVPVGGVAAAAGVPGVVGGRSVARSPPRSRPTAETASRPIPTTVSMMSFGLMAMR
jgi:hypothetical protein